jgi:probable metal-binding protein
MMVDDGEAYTKATLCAAIVERFGADARFCTCSAENMTPAQLVEFLEQRGKFVDAGEGFTTQRDKICDH